MNYAAIYEADCANGEGMRTSLFVSGCTHHCKGCFNQEAWDFEYGRLYTSGTEDYILSTLGDEVDGLSILGGEPFEMRNLGKLYWLMRRVKDAGKTLWVYTGYTWEQLLDRESVRKWGDRSITMCALRQIDVLVDGPFILEEKDISLRFRGSRNQRIIDVQKSLKERKVVLWGC